MTNKRKMIRPFGWIFSRGFMNGKMGARILAQKIEVQWRFGAKSIFWALFTAKKTRIFAREQDTENLEVRLNGLCPNSSLTSAMRWGVCDGQTYVRKLRFSLWSWNTRNNFERPTFQKFKDGQILHWMMMCPTLLPWNSLGSWIFIWNTVELVSTFLLLRWTAKVKECHEFSNAKG